MGKKTLGKIGGEPPDLAGISKASWDRARQREPAIRALVQQGAHTQAQIAKTAKTLKLSWRTVYRLIQRYRADPRTSSLITHRGGNPPGKLRLSAVHEGLIAEALRTLVSQTPRLLLQDVVLEVQRRCKAAKLSIPSRKAITKRFRTFVAKSSHEHQRIGKQPVPGQFHVEAPLDVFQIDHTLIDLMIVDEIHRQPIGRPWLTVAIDVASRVVAGFCISLDPPSATSVALCLTHACLPKEDWLAERELTADWPISGLPLRLHLDNGKEFHGEALRLGCEQYGIKLDYRPVAPPRYGGHIERLIGTLMRRLHQIPGTTFSNVAQKGAYQSEDHAVLTLRELEQWLALEIAEKYHRTRHRAIGVTPLEAWQRQALKDLSGGRIRQLNKKRFTIDFLPLTRRLVRRDGVHLFQIRYWSALLPSLIGTREKSLLRYNPRDLSHIYLADREGGYVILAYADLRHPPITLWEHKAALAALRKKGEACLNEQILFDTILKQRALARAASSKTKSARRQRERQTLATERKPRGKGAGSSAPTNIDYSKPVEPYDFEEWG